MCAQNWHNEIEEFIKDDVQLNLVSSSSSPPARSPKNVIKPWD